jgi:hypothetical protein
VCRLDGIGKRDTRLRGGVRRPGGSERAAREAEAWARLAPRIGLRGDRRRCGERVPRRLTLVPSWTRGGTGTNGAARGARAVEAPGRGLPPRCRWRAAARPGRGDRPRAGV